jgi:hypothetical protein
MRGEPIRQDGANDLFAGALAHGLPCPSPGFAAFCYHIPRVVFSRMRDLGYQHGLSRSYYTVW